MPAPRVSSVVACLALAVSSTALATERRLTQSYESAVLPQGALELELWVTPRIARYEDYLRFDNRAELEYGLLPGLQTSLYVNFDWARAGSNPATHELALSASSEWKYKLLDSVADPVGLALYGEVTGGTEGVELEAKLIVDKRVGNLLLAFNSTFENEWERAAAWEREVKLENTLGVAYMLGGLGLGAEVRAHSIFSPEGYEMTALFAGPTVSYASKGGWWAAFSVVPQLFAHKSAAFAEEYPGTVDLHDHERFNARLLVGFHL